MKLTKRTIIITLLTCICFSQGVEIKDTDDNTLISINDEGDGGGSITIPKILTSMGSTDDKLYNEGGNLYWSGSQLSAESWRGWSDGGTTVRLRTSSDNVSIGTTTTTEKLHIEGDINTSASYKMDGDVFMTNGGQTETTLVGWEAGLNNTFNGTTAFGWRALRYNTDGERNTAVGWDALILNVSGDDNTAVGSSALAMNTASNNTAVGSGALNFNTTGENNTAVGSNTISAMKTGSNNTAVGSYALDDDQYGEENTAIGSQALTRSRNGVGNVAIGYSAGGNINGEVSGGDYNTVIGNAALGYGAERAHTGNVIIGSTAGNYTAVMTDKLIIDNYSNPSGTTYPLIDGDFASNTILINGDLEYTGTLTDVSDISLKTNVKPLTNVLENISQIRGIEFDWNNKAKTNMVLNDEHQLGVIAQEVEIVYPELVKTNSKGFKTVNYTKLSAILLEAVKEQQMQIEELSAKADAISLQLQIVNK